MKKITRRRYNAHCFARKPLIRVIAQEIEWFEAYKGKLFATIFIDLIDHDYGYVILGRDARKMFRCIETGVSFLTPVSARQHLYQALQKYKNDGKELYPQDDEDRKNNEILEPVVGENKLHEYFKILKNEDRLEAARNLIGEIVYSYIDVDGNYIKEFQTHGFDARLWELYLYMYFHDAGLEIIREKNIPDYHLDFWGKEYFVEAVTVNPSRNPKRPDPTPPITPEQTQVLLNNYIPIKYGSSLYSKLKKCYWKQEHIKGKPLILAIHDYHMSGSMTWTRTGLLSYLYGVRPVNERINNGVPECDLEKIEFHTWEGKTIPSNFFSLDDAENISAVLFSNAATITKFNRMGKLAGLGSETIKMIRTGLRYDPHTSYPQPFYEDVDSPDYEESWSDSLVMIHNPNALYPVDVEAFSDISHLFFDASSNTIKGIIQPYDVIESTTCTFVYV